MNHSLTPEQTSQLQDCLLLSQDPTQKEIASQIFSQLLSSLEPNASTAEVINALWAELLAARRSAMFWQQMSDAEKGMSEQLAQSHIQLQQNHLRLVQEQ